MKKILFIHHAAGWGGAPLNMINIINGLNTQHYAVHVLLLKDSVVADKLSENNISFNVANSTFYKKFYQYFSHTEAGSVKWYRFFRLLKLSALWILSRFYFSKKELAGHKFDIVHLNSSVLSDWLGPCSRKGKVVYHIQEPLAKGLFGLRYLFFRKQVQKYADKIIAISRDNADRINLPEKTEIIYNYASIPKIEIPQNSYASRTVLYLGGSAFIKGFYTMVDTVDYIEQDIKVYFCGYYSTAKKKHLLKDLIKKILPRNKKERLAINKMRSHPNAIELGMINNVSEYLNTVCCLVSPFAVPHFSRPVIEAYLHKKPAIGSDVQGMDEIIKDKENGIIVAKNDPKNLARAINLLCTDHQQAQKYGELGYETALAKFSPDNIDLFEKVYDDLTVL